MHYGSSNNKTAFQLLKNKTKPIKQTKNQQILQISLMFKNFLWQYLVKFIKKKYLQCKYWLKTEGDDQKLPINMTAFWIKATSNVICWILHLDMPWVLQCHENMVMMFFSFRMVSELKMWWLYFQEYWS